MNLPPEIDQFLSEKTSQAWCEAALAAQDVMLIDHAHCEKKAASTALSLIYRYADKPDLLKKMSRLAREELRHFEKVLDIIAARDIEYRHLSPAKYASGLHQHRRDEEPYRLIDSLIIGSIIEARSCERFALIAPHLDDELGKFYSGLLAAEARHFQDYLHLARTYANESIDDRIAFFLDVEGQLIAEPADVFRFHSGPVLNKKGF